MEEEYRRIQRFLAACDDLVEGKFIHAEGKMTEALKAIAASGELTELFAAVTSRFDYPAAKRAYLKFPAEKGSAHGAAFLPAERTEILAFVFCLLVEFDAGTMQFNDFLLRYFYEDGSYTASYALFVGRMIRPFRQIVRDCYPDAVRASAERETQEADDPFAALAEAVAAERTRIASALSETDKKTGELILSALATAAEKKDGEDVCALLAGYGCFLRCAGEDGVTSSLSAFIGRGE